jgi:small-conductance mechanosensitive channel
MLNSEEDKALLQTFVEHFTPQMFCCGYDHQGEDQKATFDSWKGIQQHYRLYHKVSIYRKRPWNSEIPKYRVIETEENNQESSQERKRKRSIRKSTSEKVTKTTTSASTLDESDSSVDDVDKFQTFLHSISLLAKVTDNSDLLHENLEKVLQDVDEDFVKTTIQPLSTSKLNEYQVKKSNYEKDIEQLTKNCGSLTEEQNVMLQKIPMMNRKEFVKNIQFCKLYLTKLELYLNIFKNPEYVALLFLQKFY